MGEIDETKTRVVVTGASGFLGKNLHSFLSKEKFTFLPVRYRNDTDLSFLDTADVIIHLGGKAHDVMNTTAEEVYFQANYTLTKKLFDHFLNSQAKTFIFLSSVKAVADSINEPLTEELIAKPASIYGKSKLIAEEYILQQTLLNDQRVFILRPCMIHGSGNKGNLNLLYKIVSKGFPWPLGAFDNKRSFCSIDNFCFIINELIINNQIPHGVYNIADDVPVSTNELINLISNNNRRKPLIWNVPKFIINIFAKIGDIFKLPLNSESLVKLTESYIVSNNKIKNVINKPFPLSSIEGLKKTLNSFKIDA
jgi:nucleoside-diphosphate-sugar epimerase